MTTNPFAPGQPWLADQPQLAEPVEHSALIPAVDTPAEAPAELVIRVIGEPVPQGSKNAFVRGGRAVVVDVNPGPLKAWRKACADAIASTARRERWTRFDGAIEVGIVFFLERPATAPKRRVWPEKKPDIDKLARGVLDALGTSHGGGAIVDDARIVRLEVWKTYAKPGVPTGARIVVRNGVDETRPVVLLYARQVSL